MSGAHPEARGQTQANLPEECYVNCVYALREHKMSELIEMRDKTLYKEIIDNPHHIHSELLPGKRQKNLRKREHPVILPNIRTERFKRFFAL